MNEFVTLWHLFLDPQKALMFGLWCNKFYRKAQSQRTVELSQKTTLICYITRSQKHSLVWWSVQWVKTGKEITKERMLQKVSFPFNIHGITALHSWIYIITCLSNNENCSFGKQLRLIVRTNSRCSKLN